MTFITAGAVAGLVLAGAALAWRVGGPSGRPFDPAHPVRVLVLVYVAFYGAGSIALAAAGEATAGPLVVGAAFVVLAGGVWLGKLLFGQPVDFQPEATVGSVRALAAAAAALVGMAGYSWLAVEHGIPLLSDDPQTTRSHYGGVRFDAFRWLVPPAALVTLGLALARPSRRAWIAAIAITAGVVGLEALAASRALPFELGMAGILTAMWAGRRIAPRNWLAIALAGLILFLGVQFARIGDRGGFSDPAAAVSFAVNRTIGRVVLIHPRTIETVVMTFPEEEPYLAGGTYVRWLSGVMGTERPESLGSMLFRRLFPDEPVGGFAAPGLLGEAWANGGPVLAALFMLLLGILASTLSSLARGMSSGAVDRTIAALLTVALARTYAMSLNGFLLTVIVTTAWWIATSGRYARFGESAGALRRLVHRENPS